MIEAGYVLGAAWVFLLGATIGSFANVCIYRIPWQKSVIWPASHCPRCVVAIPWQDNVPILGWLLLRGRCRSCGLPISPRYPAIEAFSGLLFVAVTAALLVYGGRSIGGRPMLEPQDFGRVAYHLLLVAFLLVATFVDYDHRIIPDGITVPGMILGMAIGWFAPEVRIAPNAAGSSWDGFLAGLVGFLVGGGMIWAIRLFGRVAFRKEAMGFGDVTLMAMMGSFLGWQILPPTLFLAAFLGLVEPILKTAQSAWLLVVRGQFRRPESELPFGPYLSLAAVILLIAWPWAWTRVFAPNYKGIAEAVRWMTTGTF